MNTRWWIGAAVMFALMFDIALVMLGQNSISHEIHARFQIDPAPGIFCFVAGGLFVHFIGWVPKKR